MADTNSTNAQQNTNPNASAAQSPLLTGRKKIYWNPVDLSVDENVLEAVEQTMIAHQENREAMRYLKDFTKADVKQDDKRVASLN